MLLSSYDWSHEWATQEFMTSVIKIRFGEIRFVNQEAEWWWLTKLFCYYCWYHLNGTKAMQPGSPRPTRRDGLLNSKRRHKEEYAFPGVLLIPRNYASNTQKSVHGGGCVCTDRERENKCVGTIAEAVDTSIVQPDAFGCKVPASATGRHKPPQSGYLRVWNYLPPSKPLFIIINVNYMHWPAT